jgi:hypothetical protein
MLGGNAAMLRFAAVASLLAAFLSVASAVARLMSGSPLPYRVVANWAQLPAGWNFGEVASVDVDKYDNVWVSKRGTHPVIEKG